MAANAQLKNWRSGSALDQHAGIPAANDTKSPRNWPPKSSKAGHLNVSSAEVFSDPAEAVANCLFSSWKLETIWLPEPGGFREPDSLCQVPAFAQLLVWKALFHRSFLPECGS
jgi:hypothetical protein